MSAKVLGVMTVLVTVLAFVATFNADSIGTRLKSWTGSAETVQAEFPRQYRLISDSAYHSDVKIAGVVVGKVTDVEETDRGTALVTMQVDEGVRDKLGDRPSAAIRPTLVTGGIYYVTLTPGGDGEFDDPIPAKRTTTPVELDQVLGAVSGPDAKEGIRSAIGQTDATLRQGGTDAVRRFAADAPDALRPAGVVLDAVRGTRPATDLTRFVAGLESTASAFNRDGGRIGPIIESLNSTTAALAAGSEPLADAVSTGAQTLRVTRAGLADLQPTLENLADTAEQFRPAARQLDPFLQHLNPVLERARPVVADLRAVARDGRPLLDSLVPTAEQATAALDDVRGPVLKRVNGPIRDVVHSPFRGTGVWEGTGGPEPLYKELGYLIANAAVVFDTHDGTVSMGRLQAGVGGRSVGGGSFPKSLEQYLEQFGLQQPIGPQDGPGASTGPQVPDSDPSDQSGGQR